MAELTAADLAVVIPTRDRWDILGLTLASLANQTVSGFETIVVVDGMDQTPPPLDANRVLVERRAGPAAARNAGVRATERSVVIFLGDDTIPAPDLVQSHLATHRRHPQPEAAAVGFVGWHRSVEPNRINRWLEWSGTQSWYTSLSDEHEQEVSHWYFYTSNLSVKRCFIQESGGFDEDFPFAAFEDLECGLRLSHLGLRLYYEPAAVCHHLHAYDWPSLERRFATMALSERLMVDKHPELDAGCLGRMKAARVGRVLPLERFVDIVPAGWKRLDRFVRRHADRSYHRRLAPVYLDAWDRAAELCELRRYLGEGHSSASLVYGSPRHLAEPTGGSPQEAGAPQEERLFELARRALTGMSNDALSLLRHHLPPRSKVLDYGCGIGSDGLELMRAGYSLQFADHPGPPLAYLKWRLANRGLTLPVYELGLDELPGDIDAAFCLDAAGQGRDPLTVLKLLEQVSPTVALGILPAAPGYTSIPLDELARGTGRSQLETRHELPGGSLLLLFCRQRPDSRTPDESPVEHLHDGVGQGRGR